MDALLDSLKEILHRKRSNDYYAAELGVSIEEIEWARNELKKQGIVGYKLAKNIQEEILPVEGGDPLTDVPQISPDRSYTFFKEDVQEGTAEASFVLPTEIRDLKDLEKLIDLEKWEITKYVQNYWGNAGRPSWQVKAWLSLRAVTKEDAIVSMLERYQSNYKPFTTAQLLLNTRFDRPTLSYIALTDVHLDKTNSVKQSLHDKIESYKQVLQTLVLRAYGSHYVDEILYVLGHDFFNSDTYYITTTNGTQQENNSQWDEAYEKGFDLQVWAIRFLKQFCNRLHVVYIPGNHDRTKTFYLTHALEVHFKADTAITFNRSSENTKAHVYGENFIGMHHGDTKIANLPLYCASKFYREWGSCRFKEIGVGDKHHKKGFKLQVEDVEIEGVRLFMTPSLGGHGKWDNSQLYDNSLQAGICRVYDKEKGKVTEFEERI